LAWQAGQGAFLFPLAGATRLEEALDVAGEAGGSHCLREAGWRGRDKSIRFPPMPAAARDRITARRAPKNAEKAEPVLRGSVTRWCYG